MLLSSLLVPSSSPSKQTICSAISLLVSRFALSDKACNELTLDIFSPSTRVRERTKHILTLLDNYPLPTDFPKPDILRADVIKDFQDEHGADPEISFTCMRFFRALGRMNHGIGGYRDVAIAVEAAMRTALPLDSLHMSHTDDAFDELRTSLPSRGSVPRDEFDSRLQALGESLEELITGASRDRPVRVPTAALSALMHAQANRRDLPVHRSTMFPEESPEEAEVRRRRNRAARVMEIAEEYIIV